ncbi:hypothetical protein KC343_g2298 [Hortaea werneckii]|nr:hypothetical protein KC352_g19760 [Hortaea werneckii]KAI7570309.1 hypothetical protein KC317_g2576 [Hortaea werneckii]KAI7624545.1 hypothetical protein KC346_g2166 [Hortaea werneckii]KAI7634608.1 hypothetical protein KC343_g2298 [Hortaea werneckii]KAI7679840.1 hypothetical protein KC319_g2533 [Hortaea werneckii]
MSDAGPSRQSIPNVAPHLKQFAEATNLPIDEARVKLAAMAKSELLPPPPAASAQWFDKSEASIAQAQQMSHNNNSPESEIGNLRNELNRLKNQYENGMPTVEKKVQFLHELNFPECEGVNAAWKYYESNGRLPPSLADKLDPSLFQMGSIAGALPASQSNNTPMVQNMMPQQYQMMQQFSNTPTMQQQQQPLQSSQLPYGMNPSPMGYAPNQYNMQMPAGQPQPQQQHPMMQQLPQTISNPTMTQQQYQQQYAYQLPHVAQQRNVPPVANFQQPFNPQFGVGPSGFGAAFAMGTGTIPAPPANLTSLGTSQSTDNGKPCGRTPSSFGSAGITRLEHERNRGLTATLTAQEEESAWFRDNPA